MGVRCFLVRETGRQRFAQHAAATGSDANCPGLGSGQKHRVDVYGEWHARGDEPGSRAFEFLRLPIKCQHCDALITTANGFAWNSYPTEFVRPDTGQTAESFDAFGPGAMWLRRTPHACFAHEPRCEAHLLVILPNGTEWDIDSRASNCTMRDDKVHHCWIREGDPPNVTAGKSGVTCAAGAGSIQSGDYHGFLRGGEFT